MQNEEFDDLIRRKMQGSQSTPPPIGFERIKASLPEPKRRFPFWFWVPALLFFVGVGGGIWLFQTSSQLPETIVFDEDKSTRPAMPAQSESNDVSAAGINKNVATGQKQTSSYKENSSEKSNSEPFEAVASHTVFASNFKKKNQPFAVKGTAVQASEIGLSNLSEQASFKQMEEVASSPLSDEKSDFILLKAGSIHYVGLETAGKKPTIIDTAGMTWAYPTLEKASYRLQFEPFASVKWASKNISIQSSEQMDVAKQSSLSASRFQYEAGLNMHKSVAPFLRIFGGVSLSYLQDETAVVHHSTTAKPCNLYQSADGNMHLLPQAEAHNLNISYKSLMFGGQLGAMAQLTSNLGVWGNFRLHRQWKNAEVKQDGYVSASLHTRLLPSAAIGFSRTLLVRDGYRFSLDPFVEFYSKGAIRVGDMYQSKPMFFGIRASVLLN
jgi:hypothetical protein